MNAAKCHERCTFAAGVRRVREPLQRRRSWPAVTCLLGYAPAPTKRCQLVLREARHRRNHLGARLVRQKPQGQLIAPELAQRATVIRLSVHHP